MSTEGAMLVAGEAEAIPLETLQHIADAAAFERWGDRLARGRPHPLRDGTGTYACVFPYALGLPTFPTDDEVFDHIRQLRAGAEGDADVALNRSTGHGALTEFGQRFGSVCVSTRVEDPPVAWVAHFLDPFYFTAEAAREEAERRLGGPATIVGLHRLSPEQDYLLFRAGDATEVIDAAAPDAEVASAVLSRTRTGREKPWRAVPAERSWLRLATAAAGDRAADVAVPQLPPGTGLPPVAFEAGQPRTAAIVKKIDNWELIPIVQHTPKHWCVVASKAMVLGFYDNYVKGKGTLAGFGRFIDHWYELMPGGYNTPNLADEFVPPSDASVINGYQWNWHEEKTPAKFWGTLKTEIDAGRPCFFSIPGHTTAAFGYRLSANGEPFAIVYDPPNPKVPTYVNEYPLADCIGIGTVVPFGGTPAQHLIIIEPDGGETFRTSVPNEIVWFSWGTSVTHARLSISYDGGNAWQVVADNVPVKGGWNGYAWMAGLSGNRVRVKVEGLAAANTLIAADGSYTNLSVTPAKAGTSWKRIWGPTACVLARTVAGQTAPLVIATPMCGDGVYRYDGAPDCWTKIGGPGLRFALDDAGHLYGISPGGNAVFRYDGNPMAWTQIGGPASAIYAGGSSLFATNPETEDIYRYQGAPMSWTKVGGPGKAFTVDRKGRLYGVSPNGAAIFRYDGAPMKWTRIAQHPTTRIFAGGCGLYATGGTTSDDVYYFTLAPMTWVRVGSPGKMFAVDDTGRLYGLSPDAAGVFRYDGSWDHPQKWTQVGGPARMIFAGGDRLFATTPTSGDLMLFD